MLGVEMLGVADKDVRSFLPGYNHSRVGRRTNIFECCFLSISAWFDLKSSRA